MNRGRRAAAGLLALATALVAGCTVTVTVPGGPAPGTPAATTDLSPPAAEPETPPAIPTAMAPKPARPAALPATVNCEYPDTADGAVRPVQPPQGRDIATQGTVPARLVTSAGALLLTLDRALAPCTVNSFVSLVKQGFYNGTPCHRLTVNELQVLQCGDPSGRGDGGPGYSFADEVFPELRYGRGLVAMANAGPDTNGSQFFIVYGSADLPPGYTVFGTLDEASIKKVDEIARSGTIPEMPGSGDGKPANTVTIETVTVEG